MRTVSLLFMTIVIAVSVAIAEEGDIRSAQTSLDYTLSTLLRSVEKLSQENREIAAANDRLKPQLDSLQNELSSLQRDDDRILEQFSSLEDKYQKKMVGVESVARQIALLQEEASSLDVAMAEISSGIAAKEQSDEDLRVAIEQREEDLRGLMSGATPDVDSDAAQLAVERDRLREQARSGLLSLQRIRGEWLQLQEVVQGGPQHVGILKKDKDSLIAALETKKISCSKLDEKLKAQQKVVDSMASTNEITPAGIYALEQEIRDLKEKFNALNKDLAGAQKGEASKVREDSDATKNEQRQLEAKVVEASERNKSLKVEIDQLRRKMVDMDKKKILLEKAVYGAD